MNSTEPEDFNEPCVALVLPSAEITLVDSDVYHEVAQFRWYSNKAGAGYVARKLPRSNRVEYLHRRINRTPRGTETDHVNTFSMDNRRSNLRDSTRSLNEANKHKRNRHVGRRPSSRYKGVSWEKGRGRWQVHISVNGKQITLGYSDSELEAAAMYDAAAREHFGEFARTNL